MGTWSLRGLGIFRASSSGGLECRGLGLGCGGFGNSSENFYASRLWI